MKTQTTKWLRYLLPWLFLLPIPAHASFIESTIGTAVVNDATASYYNPAALVLLKNPQIIPQETDARFNTKFTGNTTAASTGITESGTASSTTDYNSPSLYLGMPTTDKVMIGLAIVSDAAYRNAEDNSILRYVQPGNNIQDYDVVPALAIKINNLLSLGAGINFSYANFDSNPINGFPGSNIADSQNHNQSNGSGVGGNAGFLLRPTPRTLIGFNYRSKTTYSLSGSSIYNGAIHVVSNNYHYQLGTPARAVLSISHFVTKQLGFITTIQRIQFSTLTNTHVYGIASALGTTPVILNGSIPYYLHNAWIVTLGTQYRITPKWIVRVAGSYNQSPGNPHYQVTNGDSIILGGSMGYQLNKTFTIDGSYAHAFIKNEPINIAGSKLSINGTNTSSRDAVSLRLTINM